MKRLYTMLSVLFVFSITVNAENWPAWRGPDGDGRSDARVVPLKWSGESNIKWKVALPGPGNSTPIVWGDEVFLTGAVDEGERRSLMCFNRTNGKLKWEREVKYLPDQPTHRTNPYAAASPVTNGEVIVVWHGSAGVYAYDMDGKELWRRDLGKFTHIWGYASSPVIVDDTVVLTCGPGIRMLLVGLDVKTGKVRWERQLKEAQSETPEKFKGTWATPVLREIGGRKELVLGLPQMVVGFDPKNGKENWRCKGLSDLVYTSALIDKDVIVSMSGYMGPAMACRVPANASGDVTKASQMWIHPPKNPQRVGSGVVVDGYVYILNENAEVWCIEISTGKIMWKEKLSGKSWSSMSYVGGHLFAIDMKGTTTVMKPNTQKCEIVSVNKLDGVRTNASLAFSNGQIFARTHQHLYCIGLNEVKPGKQ